MLLYDFYRVTNDRMNIFFVHHFHERQDLLGQVSGTAVLDCYSNFGSSSGTGKGFDSGSG